MGAGLHRKWAAALIGVGAVLALAGCGSGGAGGLGSELQDNLIGNLPGRPSAAPTVELVDPVELVNMWRVSAPGEDTETWLRLNGSRYDLWRPCGPIAGGWAATASGLFVASRPFMAQAACGIPEDIPWLTSTATFARISDGWQLLDAAGAQTATLRIDGIPPAHPNVWDGERQPPEVTHQVRAVFTEPPPLPSNLVPPTAEQLARRWVPEGRFATQPYVQFYLDGTYLGSDGCNGVSGAWRLAPDGRMLGTTGVQTAIGCDGVPMGAWMQNVARVGMANNNHFNLVLLDHTGAEIGRLIAAR